MINMKSNCLNYLMTIFIMFSLAACGNANSSEEIKNTENQSETKLTNDSSLESTSKQQEGKTFSHMDSVVLALNVGGEKFSGLDGHEYIADDINVGGQVGVIDTMKGSQDSLLYQSYRAGDLSIQHPVDNGLYDITFKFAEPQDIASGERVFDVLAEGEVVLNDLDVRAARDGNAFSALDRTAINVAVTDGMLNIDFKASVKEPVLNGIIVRKKTRNSKDWKLVWADEFNYTGAPDASKWTHDLWPAKKVNDENQTYTDRLDNVRVADGHLIIEAHKEKFNNAEYTSGRIHTAGKGDLLYGKIDVRAKLPAGQGTWPAIWMLPSDPFKYATNCKTGDVWQGNDDCDAWPNSGEIDIMEHVGYDLNNVHGTVHNKAYYWKNGEQRKGAVNTQNAESAFHVYSVEWTPETITILFDDIPYFFYVNERTGWEAWPYDHPYNLILNLAVGGWWGRAGGPIDESVFPVRMEIDYVRVYQ